MKKSKKKFTYEFELKENPHPGFFIAFEGLDGSGNSTQVSRIAKELKKRGLKVHVTKEPTSGPVGATIRLVLENRLKVDLQTLQMMFTVDREDHLGGERGIIKRLEKGEVVISDRYLASTLAFGFVSGLDFDWLLALQSKFVLPDITYFLEVDPAICIERVWKRNTGFDLFEKKDQLEKIKEGYMRAKKVFGRKMKVVNGEGKVKNIEQEILKNIEKTAKYKKVIKNIQQPLIKQ